MIGHHTETGRSAGFTLLEVIVALVILSLGLVTIFRIVGMNIERENLAEKQRIAILVAQSRLATVGRSLPLRPGDFRGQSNGMEWHLHIAPDPRYLNDRAIPTKAYNVFVKVHWGHQERDRVSLETLRLGPR